MTRILLAYPGGEVVLFKYKKPMPFHLVASKMSGFADQLFQHFDWAQDGDIPAIWDLDGERAILAVQGPRGKVEPCL